MATTALSHRLAIVAAGIGLLLGIAHGEEQRGEVLPTALVTKSSPAFAAQFRRWQLQFEKGESRDEPDRGMFPWLNNVYTGTARLIEDGKPSHAKLTPVAKRTRYVRANVDLSPGDLVVTPELLDVLLTKDVMRRMGKRLPSIGQLNYERDLDAARVQDFEAALRIPGKKEHVWSIHWGFSHHTETSFAGIDVWGLFTRVGGVLKPFHLRASEASGEVAHDYLQVLAVRDLNGDGIDELIARVVEYEAEDDHLAILAMERGVPVYVHQNPSR